MMEKKLPKGLDLVAAQKIIAAQIRPTEGESVTLEDALLRLPVKSMRAVKPQPGYDQSTRDGFVISGDGSIHTGGSCNFRIEGEIRAGTTDKRPLSPGTACRIMTGGLIPARGLRVTEYCRSRTQCCIEERPLSAKEAVNWLKARWWSQPGRRFCRTTWSCWRQPGIPGSWSTGGPGLPFSAPAANWLPLLWRRRTD